MKRCRWQRRERGSVTAELAVTLPALMGILALLLVCAVTGVTQLRLEEAAWAGARAAARGESVAAAAATVRRIAGSGADIDITAEGGWSHVRVSARVEGPLSELVQWPLVAEAAAQRESYNTDSANAASTPVPWPAGEALVMQPTPAVAVGAPW